MRKKGADRKLYHSFLRNRLKDYEWRYCDTVTKPIRRDVIQGDEYRVYELTPEEVQWQNDKDRGMFRRAILRNTMKRLVRKILFFL